MRASNENQHVYGPWIIFLWMSKACVFMVDVISRGGEPRTSMFMCYQYYSTIGIRVSMGGDIFVTIFCGNFLVLSIYDFPQVSYVAWKSEWIGSSDRLGPGLSNGVWNSAACTRSRMTRRVRIFWVLDKGIDMAWTKSHSIWGGTRSYGEAFG